MHISDQVYSPLQITVKKSFEYKKCIFCLVEVLMEGVRLCISLGILL